VSGRVLRWVAVVVVVGGMVSPVAADEKDPVGKLLERKFEKESVKLDYLLYLPEDYGKQDKALPLVLFLHGAGDKLERLKRGGLPRSVERKKESRFILVSPQCPGRGWSVTALTALLDDVVAKHKVDRDRVYVTGLSMGGFGTWSLAAAHPDRFAAIVPICGGGSPRSAQKLKDLPVWVFHGARDTIVPPGRSEAMVKALKDAGSEKVKFTLYPNANHDSWTATYNNPEVWEWLLKQKRADRKP
jgi:predicted peptidase